MINRSMNKAATLIIWSEFGAKRMNRLDADAQVLISSMFIEHCDKIRTLWLVNSHIKPPADPLRCTNLNSLIIYDRWILDPNYNVNPTNATDLPWVQRLVAQNEKLQFLRMDGAEYDDNVSHLDREHHLVFQLSNLFQFDGASLKITTLSLHAFRLSELELVNILQNFPRLHELELYGVTAMPGPIPRPAMPSRVSPRVEFVPSLTGEQAAFQHADLQQLTLTDTILMHNFARHMPNVKCLSFRSVASKVRMTRERLLCLLSLFPCTEHWN